MQARPLARRIRWLFITILAVAVAAGCAQPQQSDAPDDALEDGDLDGVPDGKSPVPERTDNESNDASNASAADGGNSTPVG